MTDRQPSESSTGATGRREFVAGTGAVAVGAVSALSGCLSNVAAPVGPLAVTGTAAQVTSRNTNVVVTVENTSADSVSAMLWARLTTDETTLKKNDQITVPGATEDAFTFTFDVTPSQFDYDAWIE